MLNSYLSQINDVFAKQNLRPIHSKLQIKLSVLNGETLPIMVNALKVAAAVRCEIEAKI